MVIVINECNIAVKVRFDRFSSSYCRFECFRYFIIILRIDGLLPAAFPDATLYFQHFRRRFHDCPRTKVLCIMINNGAASLESVCTCLLRITQSAAACQMRRTFSRCAAEHRLVVRFPGLLLLMLLLMTIQYSCCSIFSFCICCQICMCKYSC